MAQPETQVVLKGTSGEMEPVNSPDDVGLTLREKSQTDMASSPGEHGESEKDAEVLSGVLDDSEEGRTLSDEEFKDVHKF